MLFVFRYMRGFLRIRITGYSPERFMNLCSSHGILLWDIAPFASCYEMTVSVPDLYRLKPILKKTNTSVHILKKEGFPFLLARWKKRKIFLAGSMLCMAFLIYLSTFIWAIEVEGNEQLTREMLMAFLAERQITYGVRKRDLDIDALEKALRNECHYITWTSSKVEGTKLTIYVKENDIRTGTEQQKEESADLVADEDGIVQSIITRQGLPLVKEGQEVTAGDVLISGNVPIIGDGDVVVGHQIVRADGDVFIRCNISYKDTLDSMYQVKEYTGNVKSTYAFTAFGHTLQLLRSPQTGMYSYVSEHTQMKLLDDFYLPFYYEKKSYSEYVLSDMQYTEREAGELLNKNLISFCEDLEEKGVQILEKDVKMRKEKKQFCAQGTLTVLKKAERFEQVQSLGEYLAEE